MVKNIKSVALFLIFNLLAVCLVLGGILAITWMQGLGNFPQVMLPVYMILALYLAVKLSEVGFWYVRGTKS